MASLVKDLIAAGIHFGHRSTNWNPKMAPYIHGKKNKIHIIDPKATIKGLLLARKFISKAVAEGKDILFVGTKRQARACIEQCVKPTGMPYVTERWLGGTLTNFRTIRERLKRLEELEGLVSSGAIHTYSKKMESQLTRERLKILRNLDGIRNMTKLPGAMVVVDVKREINAVKEARKLGIPTICLIDTDSDPDYADIPIPGNDDAMRAIELVISSLCAAVQEGKQGRAADKDAAEAAGAAGEEDAATASGAGHRPRRSSRAQFRAVEATAQPAVGTAGGDTAPTPPAPADPTPPAPAAQP
jgi:small subunit ribosomal protein S2